jgi:hypothetical protein
VLHLDVCGQQYSLCCSGTYLHYRCLCCTRTCLHIVPELQLDLSALQSPVLDMGGFHQQGPELNLDVSGQKKPASKGACLCCFWSLDLSIYTTDTCAALGRVYTLGPELHLDVSTQQIPVLHLDLFPLQGPLLHLDVSTVQSPVLHIDVSTLQGPQLHLDVSTLQVLSYYCRLFLNLIALLRFCSFFFALILHIFGIS